MPGLGLDPLLDWSLLYVQICSPSSTDLSRDRVCTGVVVPVLMMELVSHPTVFSLVYKSMYEAGGKIIYTFVAGIIHNN